MQHYFGYVQKKENEKCLDKTKYKVIYKEALDILFFIITLLGQVSMWLQTGEDLLSHYCNLGLQSKR